MTTCPSCGVAVVPGYVKCPRCGTRLPSIRFRQPGATADAGGTAVDTAPAFPWWIPVAGVGAVVVIVVLVIALRGRGKDEAQPPPPVAVAPPRAQLVPVTEAPALQPVAPAVPIRPSPVQFAEDLRQALDHQRLWSTVRVDGTELEIRSGSCGDPQMKPALDGAAAGARAAGLTRIRCVEASGAVAVTREL